MSGCQSNILNIEEFFSSSLLNGFTNYISDPNILTESTLNFISDCVKLVNKSCWECGIKSDNAGDLGLLSVMKQNLIFKLL